MRILDFYPSHALFMAVPPRFNRLSSNLQTRLVTYLLICLLISIVGESVYLLVLSSIFYLLIYTSFSVARSPRHAVSFCHFQLLESDLFHHRTILAEEVEVDVLSSSLGMS